MKVPARWMPPGYAERARHAFERHKLSAEALAEKHRPIKGFQISRWLKALPEKQSDLERFANALGVSWQFLLTGIEARAVHRSPATEEREDAMADDPNLNKAWPKVAWLYNQHLHNADTRWTTLMGVIEGLVAQVPSMPAEATKRSTRGAKK